jgi:hypothetical protein
MNRLGYMKKSLLIAPKSLKSMLYKICIICCGLDYLFLKVSCIGILVLSGTMLDLNTWSLIGVSEASYGIALGKDCRTSVVLWLPS